MTEINWYDNMSDDTSFDVCVGADVIMSINQDGIVTFTDKVTPAEAAETAWNILMMLAEKHNKAIRDFRNATDGDKK